METFPGFSQAVQQSVKTVGLITELAQDSIKSLENPDFSGFKSILYQESTHLSAYYIPLSGGLSTHNSRKHSIPVFLPKQGLSTFPGQN